MKFKMITIMVCMFVAVFFFCLSANASDDTIVRIDPHVQIISPGESFSFDVVCTPDVPVKSFELKLSFDPGLVHITSVSEGDLFDGYQNFPNLGSIDNATGHILDVFDLILGPGNVSAEGTCITVTGLGLSSAGNTSLHLYDVGVTNETGYLPIEVVDGYVNIQHNIVLSDPSPGDGAESIGKNRDSLSLKIMHKTAGLFDYSIISSPNIGSIVQLNQSNGTKTCDISGLSYETFYEWTVSVQEVDTGNWTNQTFSFTTESEPNDDGGGGSGGGGGGGFPPPPPVEEPVNTAPETPLRPSGPLYIEPGVNYVFETESFDRDGDQIQYRFDWGDENLSAWSNYMDSNQSVSMVYQWMMVSNFTVKVICQDVIGDNSSWSEGLTVVCKALDDEELGSPPDANFTLSDDIIVNETVSFNASISSDVDGDIVSYSWDFGDGVTATGMNPVHQYDQPGVYEVTLVVTDSKGNSFSKTMTITIPAEGDVDGSDVVDDADGGVPWALIFGGLVGACIIGWMIIRRGQSLFPWIDTKQEAPSRRYLFDDLSISETFHDGIQKVKGFSERLLSPLQGSDQRPIGLQQQEEQQREIEENIPSHIDGQPDTFDDAFSKPIKNDSSDTVDTYFGRYNHEDVRKRLNRIFKEQTSEEDEDN